MTYLILTGCALIPPIGQVDHSGAEQPAHAQAALRMWQGTGLVEGPGKGNDDGCGADEARYGAAIRGASAPCPKLVILADSSDPGACSTKLHKSCGACGLGLAEYLTGGLIMGACLSAR